MGPGFVQPIPGDSDIGDSPLYAFGLLQIMQVLRQSRIGHTLIPPDIFMRLCDSTCCCRRTRGPASDPHPGRGPRAPPLYGRMLTSASR